jgi:hypothetical protein
MTMLKWIDWSVLARQVALVLVPLLLAQLKLPPTLADTISGPLVDVLATVLVIAGTGLVGWVIWLGQRREQPDVKIAETAALPEVRTIEVKSVDLAADIPSPKVIS